MGKKSKRSPLGCLGVLVIGIVIAIWIAKSDDSSKDTSPAKPGKPGPTTSAKPLAASRKKLELDTSPAMQAQRKELLEKLIRQGLFAKVEKPGKLPYVWVTPRFLALDFKARQEFVSVVAAYYGAHWKDPDILVILKDSRSGKRIGTFSRALGLEMK